MTDKNKPHLEGLLSDASFHNWAKNQNSNDVSYWNTWIKNNPEMSEMVFTARDIILGISFKKDILSEHEVEQALQKVMSRAALHTKATKKNSLINFSRSQWLKFAATVAILLAPFLFYFGLGTTDTITHSTAYGEIINITLPDGSQVELNGNSEISYHKENPREVSLVGQASFKIERKLSTNAKFWVNTPNLRVEVYGTEFNVSTLNDKTDVILDEGSVKLLLDNGETKNMIPGDVVSYAESMENVIHEQVKSETKYASWKQGSYVFNNVPLVEVMEYISYNYGLSFEFKNRSTENILISGGIPNGNLEICLLAIQKSSGTVINRFDDNIIIHK